MRTGTQWVSDNFIGGHPALDLANAVYDRKVVAPENELFGASGDIANWLRASGLADDPQADAVAQIADAALLGPVRMVREVTFAIFDAIASGDPPPADALGALFRRADEALSAKLVQLTAARPELALCRWRNPHAVTGFLAMLSIDAFFTLPRDRVRSCPRCGWIFLDVSRGGKRRWCNMRICGNREKVARHRQHADARHRPPSRRGADLRDPADPCSVAR